MCVTCRVVLLNNPFTNIIASSDGRTVVILCDNSMCVHLVGVGGQRCGHPENYTPFELVAAFRF